ncbi:MAG: magnesium chelatase ATPase subunit I [Pyrinomonadaceae bacterium]
MSTHKLASQENPANKRGRDRQSDDSSPTFDYPFSALVGQEEMKLALILNVIDPSIGGVLIMGHRGTGKSTAVRALVDLLPRISTVLGCRYQCDPEDERTLCDECSMKLTSGEQLKRKRRQIPLVDLPLGATEDRVCGTIDIERALKDGVKAFEPGLLARANRGFLYIDEVNLLEDHLVDLLLDVAVTGSNKVERESISIEHPAQFVLVGSGNPEEGELRPQLLDRFGLHVEVKTEDNLDCRVEIVERREAFERSRETFCATFADDQQQLRNKITRAQKKAGAVIVDRTLLRQIAQLCTDLGVEGHRGELTIARAGRALAAFEGRKKVTRDDVRRVAALSLRHRLRRDPLEETAGNEQIQQALENVFREQPEKSRGTSDDKSGAGGKNVVTREGTGESVKSGAAHKKQETVSGESSSNGDSRSQPSLPSVPNVKLAESPGQTRSRVKPKQSSSTGRQRRFGAKRTTLNYERGRYAGAVSFRRGGARVAVDATLRALAGVGYQVSGAGYRVPGVSMEVQFELNHANADSRPSRADIRNLTPDTQHPVPDARHQAPGTRYPTPDARHPAPGTRHPTYTHVLRYKRLSKKPGTLFVFAIDTSGSMALNRIRHAKGAALNLLKQSYIRRDSVAIVGFRGSAAEVLLPPSRSMLRARRVLDSLRVGGGTPLSAGLVCALDLAQRTRNREGDTVLLVFTDGGANVARDGNGNRSRDQRQAVIEKELVDVGLKLRKAGVRTVVVDTQNGFASNENGQMLAETLGARYECLRPKSCN